MKIIPYKLNVNNDLIDVEKILCSGRTYIKVGRTFHIWDEILDMEVPSNEELTREYNSEIKRVERNKKINSINDDS